MSRGMRQVAGFSLIELIVVIVISAIVAVFIVLFLNTPIESYFAQTRRSDLADSAHRISDAVTGDVRTALPNSLRINPAGTALELLATRGVGRYYGLGDKNAAAPGGQTGEELTIGIPATTFGTLDSFTTQPLPYQTPGLSVSIGNLGTATYTAYNSATKVMTPASTVVTVGPNPSWPPPPPAVAGENLVTLSAPMTFKAPGAPATQPVVHSAYLVSGPVSYVCKPNAANPSAGTLMRYSGYTVTVAQRVPPAGTGALIAHDVSKCTISIVAAPPGYPYGELAILALTLSSSGETLQVFLEAPTEYAQ
ncbi:MAG: prepilin-type N-terminal cleavage/methylation domain-containing protein [Steroidobacteraceae bacterium]